MLFKVSVTYSFGNMSSEHISYIIFHLQYFFFGFDNDHFNHWHPLHFGFFQLEIIKRSGVTQMSYLYYISHNRRLL